MTSSEPTDYCGTLVGPNRLLASLDNIKRTPAALWTVQIDRKLVLASSRASKSIKTDPIALPELVRGSKSTVGEPGYSCGTLGGPHRSEMSFGELQNIKIDENRSNRAPRTCQRVQIDFWWAWILLRHSGRSKSIGNEFWRAPEHQNRWKPILSRSQTLSEGPNRLLVSRDNI